MGQLNQRHDYENVSRSLRSTIKEKLMMDLSLNLLGGVEDGFEFRQKGYVRT